MISHKRTIPPNLWNVVVDVEGSAAWCQQTSTADGHFQGTIPGWHSQSMWSLMYRNVSSWNFLSIRAHKFICLVHLCIYIHCHIYICMYTVYIIILYICVCVFIMYMNFNLLPRVLTKYEIHLSMIWFTRWLSSQRGHWWWINRMAGAPWSRRC